MEKKRYPGKFIVFEGLDGAGAENLSKALLNYFKKKKRAVKRIYYPDYREPIGRVIHQYLHKKYNFPVEIQFLLYLADFVKDVEKTNQWLKEGKIIIADRYFTSALAYQGLRGFPQKEALGLARFFKLPQPDLIIYLKVSSDTSIKRKLKEKKSLDRNEADKKFLTRLTEFYKKLIAKQVFGRWVVTDGEKSIREVFEEVKRIIKKELKL